MTFCSKELGAPLIWIQPTVVVILLQNDRHAIMDLGTELIRTGGDDGVRGDGFALWIQPGRPEASESEQLALEEPDEIWLFFLWTDF